MLSQFLCFPVGLFENASSLHGLRKLQIRKKIQQKIDKEPLMREASFLQSTLDEGIMSHHSRAGMPLTFPLKYNSSQMYQLKYLVGRILCYRALMLHPREYIWERGQRSNFCILKYQTR